MEYPIDKTLLEPRIKEEVSRVADEAYSETGSLYDSIVLTEKDESMVDRFIDEAVNGLAGRLFDICKKGTGKLVFYVPDFDLTMEDSTKDEITNYIVYSVCVAIFKSRRPQVVPEYEGLALGALNKAISFLKSRKAW